MDANRLFFWLVWFGHLVLEKLTRNRRLCHYPILQPRKMRLASGQQIVTAAPIDSPPNELANRRRLGQNDARINVRSIGFAPGNVRLFDEQFQFAANFLASEIKGYGLLYRHRLSIT